MSTSRFSWSPVATRVIAAAVAFFAANAVVRLVLRLAYSGDGTELVSGLWVHGVTALVVAAVAFMWVRRLPTSRVCIRLFWACLIAAILIAPLGSAISGGVFFPGFSAIYFLRILILLGTFVVGAGLGILLAISLGLDSTGRAWQKQSQQVRYRV